MIILTSAEADKVRGLSSTVPYAALDPVPLKDGTWCLPDDVLTDPAHADIKPLLIAKPSTKVAAALLYGQDEEPFARVAWAGKKRAVK